MASRRHEKSSSTPSPRTRKMGASSDECNALHTVVPTSESSGRPRLQRPAYEESIECGTLPRFIQIPTAPTKNPKSETLKSTPGDAEQSTKRRCQEVTFQKKQPTSSSSGTVADSSMQIRDPQLPKSARPLSPAEREDSIQKRQRPTEVNTVLAIAGGDSRIEISTLTDDHSALHTAKGNELLTMETWASLVWWRWSTDRSRNKFSQHAGYQNKDWMDPSK